MTSTAIREPWAVRASRAVGEGIVAGFQAGLIFGIGLRVAMRVVSLTSDHPSEFTVGGTVFILIFSVVVGTPAGVVFVALARWLPVADRVKGWIFGVILLLYPGIPFLFSAQSEVQTIGSPSINVPVFGSLFLVYGVAVGWALDRIRRRAPHTGGTR